ncbi:MAG: transcriptional repressor NrdR [Firmicutes bacterium]|nr:transcriptional repressor NrdR [Bacillota bacterium]HOB35276.1 transcriptional regulator NrdR [Bacillota bacterium]HPZ89810.1 transcriptional regulator NrdR [Bacillota bacterium]HQE01174.1 transcriptional regulator NrdR [Bacillota bacterium]
MRCPFCTYPESKVVDSRPTEDGREIRRRRECIKCGIRFTTYEKVEKLPLVVVKKSGGRELFDRSKILNGLVRASVKRAIPLEKLEQLVDDVETQLRNNLDREVSTSLIGELVLERLRQLDEVAYVRFASVYREFSDVGNFFKELQKLTDRNSDSAELNEDDREQR